MRKGYLFIALTSLLVSCSTTSNLPEDEILYTGIKKITYGKATGNEKNELSFLSPEWMSALKDVQDISKENNIEVDMNCGTGWPFGGPLVPIEEAACKALIVDTIVSAADFKKDLGTDVGVGIEDGHIFHFDGFRVSGGDGCNVDSHFE